MKRLVTVSGTLLFSLAIVASIVLILSTANEATLAQADARVWVAHLAPFAATLPDTAVTVRVNGTNALTDFKFGQTSGGYLTLPAGVPLLVEIVLPGDTVAISDTFTLTADTDYTVAAIGDGTNQPLELFALVDDNVAPPAGQAKVRIAHLAPFANTLPATAVDIRADDGTLVVPNVPYKAFTDPYLTLPTGVYDLKITTPGGGTDLLDLPPLGLTDGEIVGVFAIGDGTNQPVQAIALKQVEASTARAWVAHLAPFANTLEGTAVTVRVNGITALTDFKFGETSGAYIELPATSLFVEIVLPDSTVAISGTVSLNANMDYTLAAIGDGTNQPLELFALVDDNVAPPAGQAKVRIAHLAPFANTLPATTVDIRADDGTLVVPNVPYKAFTDPYLSLPVGVYDLKITTPGGGTDLLDIPPITLTDGEIVGVFAIGDGTNQPVQVLALNQVEASMARVWVAHLAPFADTLEGTAVTVRVNGIDALTDFKFGETSGGYVDLPAATVLVEIVLPGDTVAISDTFTLAANTDYTVAAIGDGTNQPLELFALVDDNTAPDAKQGKVRIAHLAPFGDSPAATTVDIRADDGTLVVPNVPYKAFTDPYLSLPVGVYNLKITTPGGGTDLLDIPPFFLGNGQILGAFAIGDGANQPVNVLPLVYAPGKAYYMYLPTIR